MITSRSIECRDSEFQSSGFPPPLAAGCIRTATDVINIVVRGEIRTWDLLFLKVTPWNLPSAPWDRSYWMDGVQVSTGFGASHMYRFASYENVTGMAFGSLARTFGHLLLALTYPLYPYCRKHLYLPPVFCSRKTFDLQHPHHTNMFLHGNLCARAGKCSNRVPVPVSTCSFCSQTFCKIPCLEEHVCTNKESSNTVS